MTPEPHVLPLDETLALRITEGTLSIAEANPLFKRLSRRLGEALGCELVVKTELTDVAEWSVNAVVEPALPAFGPLALTLHIKMAILVVDAEMTIDALVFLFAGKTRLTGPGLDHVRLVYDRTRDAWTSAGPQEDVYGEWGDV